MISIIVMIISIVIAALVTLAVKLLNWVLFKPRKLEKFLRQQGLKGNPYRPFLGDLKDYIRAVKAAKGTTLKLSDDILPSAYAYNHNIVNRYGQNSFIWFGPVPSVNISDPELMKEILKKHSVYQKPIPKKAGKIFTGGLLLLEDEKWAKHRKIINPAFSLEKLKKMVPAIGLSCSNMIKKLKQGMVSEGCEIDIWHCLTDLTGDMISRTAFGSSHEEGTRIFQLQIERTKLNVQQIQFLFIPGWSYVPTKVNRRIKALNKEIHCLLEGIIRKRHKAMEKGELSTIPVNNNDLLGILMESNASVTSEDKIGMSTDDVIEECELFYLAGSETTASLLVWTLVLLCVHPEWQTRARDEVIGLLGNSQQPTFEDLNHLKTVTMILQEVMRFYTPVPLTVRSPLETVKLGNMTIPAGVHLTLLIGLLHRDPEVWGDDAMEFKPERFAEGAFKAVKIQSSFMPFSSGPRVCIGQNFAMIQAKMALAMMLQSFSFELSPSYVHAPFPYLTLQPQYGAPLILRTLHSLSH